MLQRLGHLEKRVAWGASSKVFTISLGLICSTKNGKIPSPTNKSLQMSGNFGKMKQVKKTKTHIYGWGVFFLYVFVRSIFDLFTNVSPISYQYQLDLDVAEAFGPSVKTTRGIPKWFRSQLAMLRVQRRWLGNLFGEFQFIGESVSKSQVCLRFRTIWGRWSWFQTCWIQFSSFL